MDKPVLVTGGAGYIGAHTCKALAKAGYQPIAYDDLSRGHRAAVRWGPLIEGDIADGVRLDAVLARFKPVAVMHFAGFIAAGESVTDPALYFRINVAGSFSLLDALQRADNPPFVFSSSAAVYGLPEKMPIAEDAPRSPVNPYGETKLMIERALHWLGQANGPRHVTLRYFNAAGADPDGEIGERHEPETHLIPLVLDAAAGRGGPVGIFGTDYPTPDGTAIRDYIHVQDLAEAHVRALDYLLAGGASTALNLGTGKGYSVREVIRAAENVTGQSVPFHDMPRRPGDPPVLVADPSRAGVVLGWRPTLPKLEDMIATAWQWQERSAGR